MPKHYTFLEDAIHKFLEKEIPICAPDFAVISDRSSWEGLDDDLRRELIEAGVTAAKEPWPILLLTDYLDFARTGNRVRFENKFFARRIRLTKLVMAECAENKSRFVDEILNGMYLIMDETTWCLPAHNSHIRDGKLQALPDTEHPVIDLFAAETGALLGLTEYLLRPILSQENSVVSARVDALLRERILVPYLTEHFWWMGDGVTPMMNWTPWITQNVLISIMTRNQESVTDQEKTKVLKQAAFSADCFIDSYGEDGCCDEGAQYYTHAGLCLFGCIDLFNRVTGGMASGCLKETVIRNIAAYIVRMYVGNGYYINFADCSARPGKRTAREYLFGKMTGSEPLETFAAQDYRGQTWQERLLPDEQNLYYHVLQAFAHDQMMHCRPFTNKPGDFWFDSTKVLVARDDHYTLAVKAGNNAESHNHNDTGSFILYKDDNPIIIDLGVETYTRQTFSDRRYEIWTMQSQYHNLPSFVPGGTADELAADAWIQQQDGISYRATQIRYQIRDDEAYLQMELAEAYQNPEIRSYRRTVRLEKGRGVVTEDHYDGDLSCVVSLMTYEKPIIRTSASSDGDDQAIIAVGDVAEMTIEGTSKIEVEECKIEDARLGAVWKHSCWRILIGMRKDWLRVSIT